MHILLLVISALLPLESHAGGISFGLSSKVWPFMWEEGVALESTSIPQHERAKWVFFNRNILKYKDLGAQFGLIDVYQEIDGPDDYVRLYNLIEQFRSSGVVPVLRLYEEKSVWDNLSEVESAHYGYNEKYYLWINEVAKRFGGTVTHYLISNEVEIGIGHRYPELRKKGEKKYVTYTQYKKLLTTAYSAIKKVNPKLQVIGHGVSNFSLGVTVAAAILDRDGIDESYNFYLDFQNGRRAPESKISFYAFMNSRDVQRRILFVMSTFSEKGLADFYQLHHYRSWESLPIILDWIQSTMENSDSIKPLFASEIGYYHAARRAENGKRTILWNKYSEKDHAEALVKDFAILMCGGVEYIEYWGIRWHHNRVSFATLYKSTPDPEDFTLTRAGAAYRYMTANFTGYSRSAQLASNNKNIWQCGFSGEYDTVVLWAKDKLVEIDLADYSDVFDVRDIYGNEIAATEEVVVVDKVPIYIRFHKVIKPRKLSNRLP